MDSVREGSSFVSLEIGFRTEKSRQKCGFTTERVDATGEALLNRLMLRPSIIALCLVTAVSLVGCESAYRRMYSPKRSYFKPDKEEPSPTEVLPPPSPVEPTPIPGGAPAPAPAPEAAPAPAPAPAPEGAAPAIPGL